jgi:dolichol-phosphate mannosyltransferase
MTDLAVLDPDHRPLAATAARVPDLALIVPTFNERDNVAELVRRFDAVLAGIAWEVIFVDDDSKDGTLAELRRLSRSDPRVRFIQRIGRRGLASAVVEGILSTSTPYIAVLDADLQHDEEILPEMLARLGEGGSEIVVGSRYLAAGGLGTLDKRRRLISRFATHVAQRLMHAELSDPMSGFFMLRRDAFDRSVRNLSSIGYKILLDVLMSARPPLKAAEVPYVFRDRVHGESKLDTAVTVEYGMLLLDKLAGHLAPVRFIMFMLVGGFGVFVHMAVLAAVNQGLHYAFVQAQTAAAVVAMTFNFFVNNALTYRDRRLKGVRQLLTGLLSFYAVCSLGALSNVGIAAFLFGRDYPWYLSGFAGIAVGAVWNYAASSILTWRK